ncbi:MAG: hypothetical protein WC558_00905 [Patulibacter sp.]
MSTSPASSELASLSAPRKLLLASGLLLLINSFLPWYHISIFGTSVSENGWNQLGTLVWIVLIATLIWEGVRIARVAPVEGQRADLITTGLAGLTLVLGVIYVIIRLSDGSLGFGFWLGVLLFIVFGYAVVQLFQASGGQAAVREVQAEAQRRAQQQQTQQPPAAPPATPPATPQQPPAGQQPPASTPPQQQPPLGGPQDPPTGP